MNKLVVARCISTIYKDVIIKIKDIMSFIVETVHGSSVVTQQSRRTFIFVSAMIIGPRLKTQHLQL